MFRNLSAFAWEKKNVYSSILPIHDAYQCNPFLFVNCFYPLSILVPLYFRGFMARGNIKRELTLYIPLAWSVSRGKHPSFSWIYFLSRLFGSELISYSFLVLSIRQYSESIISQWLVLNKTAENANFSMQSQKETWVWRYTTTNNIENLAFSSFPEQSLKPTKLILHINLIFYQFK